jgi:hypothetical protein
MRVARIRASDPEVIEFLARHLADSGYQLKFVRPEEPVHGEADLEIDASRMDLDSAMEAARNETGLVTILSGVLKAEPKRDFYEEVAPSSPKAGYVGSSPYMQGSELEDEPSMLHKAVNALGLAVEAGINAVSGATKSAVVRLGEWMARRDSERMARREEHERRMAILAEQRRQHEALHAEAVVRQREEQRKRAAEERLTAIRGAEKLGETGIERHWQEEMRCEEERKRAEEATRIEQPHECETDIVAAEHQFAVDAVVENNIVPEHQAPEHQAKETLAERRLHPVAVPIEAQRVTPSPLAQGKRQAPRATKGSRDRAFMRAGVAAAIVASGIVSFWSLSTMRRPANPLSLDQLRNSAIVKQQRPFGPATAAAPVVRKAGSVARAATPAKKPVARKVESGAQKLKPAKAKMLTAKRRNPDDGSDEVIVRHFAPPKQQQATVTVKNGVKIISEN